MSSAEHAPDLLVIDIGLPDADGRDVCQALRARGIDTPVLFLTARDALTDRLAGFSAGGDDYVTKPFDIEEVAARLQALLRRAGGDAPASSAGTGCSIRPSAPSRKGGIRLTLTPTEFRLLAALAGATGTGLRAARADSRRLAARRDRARQHTRRIHRPAAPEARLVAAAAADRHRSRHGLPPRMISRLGLRRRLELSVIVAVALSLVLLLAAFNVVLRHRLSADANNAVIARASAELAALRVVDGRLTVPELPDAARARCPGMGVRRRPNP